MDLQKVKDMLAPPSRLHVPVKARGLVVWDNGNDAVAVCFTEEMAECVARLLNQDAGL